MAAAINLLPWRQSRRSTCLRFWGALFSGSLLFIVSWALNYCATVRSVEHRANTVLIDAEKRRADALMAIKPRLQLRQQQWQQAQQRNRQRDQTRSWQPFLETLANRLPEQAWLTKITWQQNTLELVGNTLNFTALQQLETQLRQQPFFQLGRPGETQQDAQGRWQFHYRLIRSVTHDSAL